jgi:hypothetical protein
MAASKDAGDAGDSGSGGLFEGSYAGRPEPGRTRWLAISLCCAAVALAALFLGGEYLQRLVRYLNVRVPDGVVEEVTLVEPVRHMALNTVAEVPLIPDQLLADGLPLYDLRMAPSDWQRLQATMRVVTAQVIAEGVERDYVPAELWRDDEWTPIQVKLRGLYSAHYLMKRPSLRLKFPSERPFDGKRQINLLDLYDKGLTYDVTTNWELRQYGILTWESRFAVVRLNGEVLGLYHEIEQFSRSLSDRNGRPEGFILSGRGQLFGKPTPGSEKAMAAFQKMSLCHLTPPSPRCNWEFLDDYFDIDRWAWAGAMKLLLHSDHGWGSDNLRIFWDPALGRFEPIPWDYFLYPIDPVNRPDAEMKSDSYPHAFALIPEYRRLRDQRTWLLATTRVEPMIAESERLFEELRPALSHDMRHLTMARDESLQRRYRNLLRDNARYLIALYEAQRIGVRWWPADASGPATIEVSNDGKAFVSLRGVTVLRAGQRLKLDLKEPILVDGPFAKQRGRAVAHIPLLAGDELVGLAAHNEVTGSLLRSDEVALFRKHGKAPAVPPPPGPPPLELAIPGVRVESDQVVIGPGRVNLLRTLSVGAARDVVLAPGLDLKMAEGSSLIVYGNLSSMGTASEPIRISGSPGWGGVLVHGKRTQPSQVRMEHTTFEGGVGGETERVFFTAPFAIHGGNVTLRSSRFLNSRAIDAINFKYAQVDVADVAIEGAMDDAFDCDFCTGSIARVSVANVGGDGLDFSGSDLAITGTTVAGCGDKGISLGEATRSSVTQTRIADCYTGIAVKDLSEVDIRDAQLARLEVGVSLYVKKPSFGPSRARVEGVTLRDVATRVLRDESCTLEWIED